MAVNEIYRFDPASILILDRLNQVLARLDQGSSSSANTSPTAPTPGDSVQTATSDLDLAVEQESYDQLRVPSSQTTPDAILSWPVFQRQFPASFTTDPVFEAEVSEDIQDSSQNGHTRFGQKVGGVNEEWIPKLIKQFLQYVHIKNPVVDMDTLAMYAHTVSEEGIKWDTASCLVVSTLTVTPYLSLGCQVLQLISKRFLLVRSDVSPGRFAMTLLRLCNAHHSIMMKTPFVRVRHITIVLAGGSDY